MKKLKNKNIPSHHLRVRYQDRSEKTFQVNDLKDFFSSHEIEKYRGFFLHQILDELYGPQWKEHRHINLNALSQKEELVSTEKIIEEKPILAFEKLDPTQRKRIPFLLIWKQSQQKKLVKLALKNEIQSITLR